MWGASRGRSSSDFQSSDKPAPLVELLWNLGFYDLARGVNQRLLSRCACDCRSPLFHEGSHGPQALLAQKSDLQRHWRPVCAKLCARWYSGKWKKKHNRALGALEGQTRSLGTERGPSGLS